MRKLKTLLLLLFAVIGTNTFAQTTFSLSQSEIACGEQTCLQVSVQGFTNVLAFQYSMNWDAAILGNARVQSFGIGDLSAANFNLVSPGIARVGWDDSSITGISLTDNTIIFEICFDEIGGNTATSSVQFSDNPIAIEVINAAGELINPSFNNGEVVVDCVTMDGNGDGEDNSESTLTFSATQATANCGEQICVDVNTSGFANVLAFQYAMNWDANLLGVATVQNFGIANMDASQFNATTAGILRVGYDDAGLVGINLADNSLLFQVCFDLANDATGSTDIVFSDNPIAIEAIDVQGNILTTDFQSGNVVVSCDAGSGDGDNTDEDGTDGDNTGGDGTDGMMDGDNGNAADTLVFSVGQITGNCGEQVCVDVLANGFTDIISFQYAMNWDADLLGIPTIGQFGLSDMDASHFNTATPGVLRVGYDDSSLQGRSLVDGTVLYQLCFDLATDAVGTSGIDFSATPIAIEVVDVQSNILTPILQNGTISVVCMDTTVMDTMPPLPELPLGFSISADTSNCGDQVCLDVSVQGFEGITSFRYSINWNAQLLGSEEIGETNLEGIRFGPLAPGVFFTEWIDPTGQGLTLPDNEIIYTICFNQFTSNENTVAVSFSNIPIPIRVTNPNTSSLRPELSSGEIFITCNPVDMDTMVVDIADSLSFSINNAAGNCAEQTCLAITAQDFNDIFSFQYSIAYNEILGAASVQNFGLAGLSAANFNLAEAGSVRVGWDDSSLEGVSLSDDQVLFDLCFDVGANIAGGFEVAFSNTPLAIETVDADGMILNPSFQDGALTIVCEDTTPIDTTTTPETLQLTISDGMVNCGEQICLDVKASTFNDILSFQYSINWNPTVLGNASVQGFNLVGLGAGNFNVEVPGVIRTGWTDANVAGVTMAEDAVLYQICFDAIGNTAATTDVRFSNLPLPFETLDGAAEAIEPQLQNGTVTIECMVIEPPVDTIPNTGDALTFSLSSTTGDCTEQVCIEVRVNNFKDMLTYQYSMNWDANLLGQASVQAFNMAGLTAANFNTTTSGVLSVGWDDATFKGVSLPDNQVIYQICFDNINAAVENVPVSFSGTPTTVEIVDNQNNLIVPEFVNGSLTITCDDVNNGENPTVGDLIFRLAPIVGNCGEQLCTDVRVDGFRDILSFQYSLVWDANVLGATSVQSFGIPDLNAGNFNHNTPGILRIGWDDTFTTGVTLPNDHILFQVCFDSVNEPIDDAIVGYSGTPTSIEVIDRNGQFVSPTFQDGTITVNCDTNNPIDADNDGFTSDVDCDDNNPIVFPGATEFPNNNVDEDCDGIALIIDADNDGFNSSIDCDDNNPNVNA
ncbi:MAG: MopE-related protein, partial [Saprospiraceae bacterium]